MSRGLRKNWLALTVLTALAAGLILVIARGSPSAPPYSAHSVPVPTISPVRPYGIVLDKDSKVLFLGDSWTAGTGASRNELGFAFDTGKDLGVPYFVSGVGSTGYGDEGIAVPPVGNYTTRLQKLQGHLPFTPTLVIIQGSINDPPFIPNNQLVTKVLATIDQVHREFPVASTVLVGPASADGVVHSSFNQMTAQIHLAAMERHVAYLDPTGEAWIARYPKHSLENQVDLHPSDRGHQVYADRLVADLRMLAKYPPTAADRKIWAQAISGNT